MSAHSQFCFLWARLIQLNDNLFQLFIYTSVSNLLLMGERYTEKVLKSPQQLLLTSACPPSMRIYKCVKRRVNTQVPRSCTTMVHLLCLWAGHNLVVTSSQCSQCCSSGSVYCRVMKVKFTTNILFFVHYLIDRQIQHSSSRGRQRASVFYCWVACRFTALSSNRN